MATEAEQPPVPWSLRRILRGVCLTSGLFSAFFASHSLIMFGQLLNEDIPAGVIQTIEQRKGSYKLQLDSGEASLSSSVVYDQPTPITLSHGDRVEKHRGSLTYWINGSPVTNRAWVIRTVLSNPVEVILGVVYLVLGGLYIARYGRAPLADPIDPKVPAGRSRYGVAVVVHLVLWLVMLALLAAFFGCVTLGLRGIFSAFT